MEAVFLFSSLFSYKDSPPGLRVAVNFAERGWGVRSAAEREAKFKPCGRAVGRAAGERVRWRKVAGGPVHRSSIGRQRPQARRCRGSPLL